MSYAGSSPTRLLHVINGESDLARALAMIARGERPTDAIGDSGWLRQRANFSAETMAAQVAVVYREVLAS